MNTMTHAHRPGSREITFRNIPDTDAKRFTIAVEAAPMKNEGVACLEAGRILDDILLPHLVRTIDQAEQVEAAANALLESAAGLLKVVGYKDMTGWASCVQSDINRLRRLV